MEGSVLRIAGNGKSSATGASRRCRPAEQANQEGKTGKGTSNVWRSQFASIRAWLE